MLGFIEGHHLVCLYNRAPPNLIHPICHKVFFFLQNSYTDPVTNPYQKGQLSGARSSTCLTLRALKLWKSTHFSSGFLLSCVLTQSLCWWEICKGRVALFRGSQQAGGSDAPHSSRSSRSFRYSASHPPTSPVFLHWLCREFWMTNLGELFNPDEGRLPECHVRN